MNKPIFGIGETNKDNPTGAVAGSVTRIPIATAGFSVDDHVFIREYNSTDERYYSEYLGQITAIDGGAAYFDVDGGGTIRAYTTSADVWSADDVYLFARYITRPADIPSEDLHDAIGFLGSGEMISQRIGVKNIMFSIMIENLTLTEITGFRDWFLTHADGAANYFYFADNDRNGHRVRILSDLTSQFIMQTENKVGSVSIDFYENITAVA